MPHILLRTVLLSLILILLPASIRAQESQVRTVVAPEDTVMPILRQRVEVYRKGVGIVVGIIDWGERTIYSYGTLNQSTIRKVSGVTVFEIGAMTQLMTAYLLANMAERGDVGLNDPISKYLPPSVQPPTYGGRSITLLHLATHTSGLPDMPPGYTPPDPQNPLAGFTVAQLYDFLSNCKLTRDPGSAYEHSRIGVALLGHLLERAADAPYEALLVERLFLDFRMHHTRVRPTAAMQAQTATGHDEWRRPVPPSVIPELAAADGMRSCAQDLLTFVAANLGYVLALPNRTKQDSTAIAAAFETMSRVQSGMNHPALKVAMGWRVMEWSDRDILWQSGHTKGFHCFAGFDRRRRRGVVVVSNTANDVNDIGFHLLNTGFRLAPPPRIGNTARIDPLTYDTYTGMYAFDTGTVVMIRREGTRLYGQSAGQPKSELIPLSDNEFYVQEEDALVSFVKNDSGQVTHMLFNQKGQTHQAKKIE